MSLTLPPPFDLVDRRGRLPIRVDGRPYSSRPLDAIRGVAVHTTASDMSAEDLALYQTTKVEGDPYPAIAYHFLVHPDGTVEWCHDLEVETWHAGSDGSYHYLSVCFPGASDEPPTPEQLAAGRALLAELSRDLGRSLEVRAHRDLLPVAHCPGPSWPSWADKLILPEGAARA